jgi:adenylate kinase family enzyme
MQRILVIGSGGSGKSMVARRLSELLRLPLIHLDAHFWRPAWVQPSKEEWRDTVARLVAEPRWVMDGNYGGTLDMRLDACDTVIFLDLPRLVCLWRILRRNRQYRGRTRPDVAPGCPERLTWEFVEWILTYPETRRPKILKRLRALPEKRVVILSSRRQVKEFLARLAAADRQLPQLG